MEYQKSRERVQDLAYEKARETRSKLVSRQEEPEPEPKKKSGADSSVPPEPKKSEADSPVPPELTKSGADSSAPKNAGEDEPNNDDDDPDIMGSPSNGVSSDSGSFHTFRLSDVGMRLSPGGTLRYLSPALSPLDLPQFESDCSFNRPPGLAAIRNRAT